MTNVGSEVALAQTRFFPVAARLQPITIHRLVPSVCPPLLRVAPAVPQNRISTATSLGRRLSSHIYAKYGNGTVENAMGTRKRQQRSAENLVLREMKDETHLLQPTPIRQTKSMSALHRKTFVSKLMIPQLRGSNKPSALLSKE